MVECRVENMRQLSRTCDSDIIRRISVNG